MKTVVLLEMMLLFGGSIVTKKAAGASWSDLFLSGTLTKTATAVVILLAILLTLAEVGQGTLAAGFGGLIVLGYLLAASGSLGPGLLSVEQSYFGSFQVASPNQATPTTNNPGQPH